MRIVLLFLGLGMLGAGCARTPKAPPLESTAGAYYPLAVGNRWTYQARMLGEQSSRTVEITGVQNGFYTDSQGGQLTEDAYGIRDQKRYLLRNPVEQGAAWTNIVSVSSTERYAITKADFPCESPAGRFPRCVRVQGRNRVNDKTTLVNEFTFAQNVGLVRIEVYAEVEKRKIPQTLMELTSYQVAGGR